MTLYEWLRLGEQNWARWFHDEEVAAAAWNEVLRTCGPPMYADLCDAHRTIGVLRAESEPLGDWERKS